MKIQERDGTIIDIFAIYWGDDGKTLFLGLDGKDETLHAYKLEEVSIIEEKINFKSIYFANSLKGIYHWALIEKELLDDLLEYTPEAYQQFLEIVRSEGVIDW